MTSKIFISYSHEPDSEAHSQFVLSLSEQLREDGIDCYIDQYINGAPPEGWQRWMEKHIEQANFVLVVCTSTYLKRFKGEDRNGGLGVNFEGAIISQVLYDHFQQNTKFIPIIPESGSIDNVPLMLKRGTTYKINNDFENSSEYEKLYRVLTGQPRVKPKPIGSHKSYPETNQPIIQKEFHKMIESDSEKTKSKHIALESSPINIGGSNNTINIGSNIQNDKINKETKSPEKATKTNTIVTIISIIIGIPSLILGATSLIPNENKTLPNTPINSSSELQQKKENDQSYVNICVMKKIHDIVEIVALNNIQNHTNKCNYEQDIEEKCCTISNLIKKDKATEIQIRISKNNTFLREESVNIGTGRSFDLRN